MSTRQNAKWRRKARIRLLARDGANVTCFWCKRPLFIHMNGQGDPDYATIEHKIRLADGGTNRLQNLTWSCPKCNHTRHTS